MKISITVSDDIVKYADQVSNLERLILKLYSERKWVDRTRWRKESGYVALTLLSLPQAT